MNENITSSNFASESWAGDPERNPNSNEMTKIFDPKIQLGRWVIETGKQIDWDGKIIDSAKLMIDGHDIAMSPALKGMVILEAVPEMVKVVRAAQEYFRHSEEFKEYDFIGQIKNCLDELNEKHGTAQNNETN